MTRDDWCLMWEAIKRIEYQALKNRIAYKEDREIIKNLIQKEIGQME